LAVRILVIEDDESYVSLLRFKMRQEGYEILSAPDGVEGIKLLQQHNPDVVLLDLMMPRMDGFETCRRIRRISDVPVIFITALGGETNAVRGLELGADDYITKPCSLLELVSRIRATLRRCRHPSVDSPLVEIDERLTIDRVHSQVIVEGQDVKLSPTEYRLLDCLLDNMGRVLTHQSLLTQVWGWEYCDETDYLKVYIHNLRRKIEQDLRNPCYIITERGLGYRFQIP
jgi:two-component system KDP operon response regulator KdpE